MPKNLCLGFRSLLAAGSASLFMASAIAATPQVKCTPGTFGGIPACLVDMSSYAFTPITHKPVCPPSVTTTGAAPVCQASFAAAMADARLFFANGKSSGSTYVIGIDGGTYDLTSETSLLPGQNGVIEVAKINPTGNGCIQDVPSRTGNVVLTGNGCLVVAGIGASATTLVTANGLSEFHGSAVSHLLVENLTFTKPAGSITQGIYVSRGTQTFHGVAYPTLTLDIPQGFPTPLALWQLNCAANAPHGCSAAGLPTVVNDVYLRAFTGGPSPAPILSPSTADENSQYPFGYPQYKGSAYAAVPPIQPDPVNNPQRWTLVMSSPASVRTIPDFYSGSTGGVPNLVCMKYDNGPAFWFDDSARGGTDIIVNRVTWIGSARSTFRGVRGALGGYPRGAQIYNSTIARAPAVGGVTPCLSTQAGGIQIGQPSDAPIWGNVVYGLNAVGTADDTVAIFNDIGGTRNSNGVALPVTVVEQSSLLDSFGHDLKLYNDHAYSGYVGNSPVFIDSTTQAAISADGGCDPLLGTCPVDYLTY